MRILAIDHGEKRIGLALSDETRTLARPLMVLAHVSRAQDAALVAEQARLREASLLIVGVSYDEAGELNMAGRRAANFAAALREQTSLPVELWDESLTTQDARRFRLEAGASRKRRAGHMDEAAAAVLLQDYLEHLRGAA